MAHKFEISTDSEKACHIIVADELKVIRQICSKCTDITISFSEIIALINDLNWKKSYSEIEYQKYLSKD